MDLDLFYLDFQGCAYRVGLLSQRMGSGFGDLIFLHEGLGCLETWKKFPARLCRLLNCRGVVLERDGYGKTPVRQARWSLDYLREEALEVLPALLDRLSIHRGIFYGHSDGATIALLFGAAFPSRCKALCLEAPHIYVEDKTLSGIREAVTFFDQGPLRAGLTKYHGEKTEIVFRRWAERWLSPAFRDWSIVNQVRGYGVPTLVIQGEDDPYAGLPQIDELVSLCEGPVEKCVLPGCGHQPHKTHTAEVLESASRFLMDERP